MMQECELLLAIVFKSEIEFLDQLACLVNEFCHREDFKLGEIFTNMDTFNNKALGIGDLRLFYSNMRRDVTEIEL